MTVQMPPAAPAPDNGVQEAADRLSAYFMRSFLKEAKVGESLIGGPGGAGAQFADMLRDSLADAMTKGEGVGLTEAIAPGFGPAGSIGSTMAAIRAHAAVGRADPKVAIAPVEASVSSGFGLRVHPVTGEHAHHAGVDLAAPAGSPVKSAGGGVVVRAEEAGNYGNLVVVDHGDGLQTRYAHLASIDVEEGAHIDAGTVIGSVGDTGRTTGAHLHFEVRRHGHAENPLRVVSGLNAGASRSR